MKDAPDSYGFTFTRNYLQVQFTGYSQYKFTQNPFITIRTNVKLNPGNYTLKYNIQTRPNFSWEHDKQIGRAHV